MGKENFIQKNKVRVILIFMIAMLLLSIVTGCGRSAGREAMKEIEQIELGQIQSIRLFGTTGGKDGEFSYILSENQSKEFVELLKRVKLGNEVDKEQTMTNGAVAYYKLSFFGKDSVTVSPGWYFNIEDTYYKFLNYEELWEEFISFNSLR